MPTGGCRCDRCALGDSFPRVAWQIVLDSGRERGCSVGEPAVVTGRDRAADFSTRLCVSVRYVYRANIGT